MREIITHKPYGINILYTIWLFMWSRDKY